MPDRPDISILMPNYNGQRFLDAAIRSTVAQTLTSWELIVLDDGSTDQSKSIVRKWMQKDARIRLEELEHGGIVKALNRGIELARADVIARMDSDDLMLPERLMFQWSYLKNHPEELVGTQALLCDPRMRTLGLLNPPEDHASIFHSCLSGMASSLMHPTLMASKSIFEQLGGYREDYRHIEDLDLYLRAANAGFTLHNLTKVPLLRYRMHARSISNSKNQLQMELKKKLLEEFEDQGTLQPDWQGLRKAECMLPKTRGEFFLRWSYIAHNNGQVRMAYWCLFRSLICPPYRLRNSLSVLRTFKSFLK
jgi:glycosyltransferase involved in cell wall biosynthesis